VTAETKSLVGFIDATCGCERCVSRTTNMYRMVGYCSNCRAGDFLLMFRAGDLASARDCPRCGCYNSVNPYRAATADEIPIDAERLTDRPEPTKKK
jgi:hypothetical protein